MKILRSFLLLVAGVLFLPVQNADAAPDEVMIGAFINDIKEVDLVSNSYSVDMYVWLRWKNPTIDPSISIEAMNPRDSFLVATRQYEEPLRLPDGSLYNSIRFVGAFSSKLNVANYPFDRHTLRVIFEDSKMSASEMVFVPDVESTLTNPELLLPGWISSPTIVRVENKPYPTNWGMDGANEDVFSRAFIEVPVSRPVITSAIKLFFPLLVVLAMGVMTFFLRPRMVESKVSVAITVLLTLVALQITTMGALPPLGYLSMIEFLYAISFVFVLYILGVTISTAWTSRDPESVEAVAFDRRTAAYGTVAYLVAVAATMLAFLV